MLLCEWTKLTPSALAQFDQLKLPHLPAHGKLQPAPIEAKTQSGDHLTGVSPHSLASRVHADTAVHTLASAQPGSHAAGQLQLPASTLASSLDMTNSQGATTAAAAQKVPAASAIDLLQTQAAQAEQREAQRRIRQERFAALQQNLALQHRAAGTARLAVLIEYLTESLQVSKICMLMLQSACLKYQLNRATLYSLGKTACSDATVYQVSHTDVLASAHADAYCLTHAASAIEGLHACSPSFALSIPKQNKDLLLLVNTGF